MTRRARKGTPPPDALLTVPGLRVLVVSGDAPHAPPQQVPTAEPAALPAAQADHPPVRRKRRIRFVF
jgi:hypothetical protein